MMVGVYRTRPPLAVHSSVVEADVQPVPLQAFSPLHDELPVLHALWPLQELVPPHLIVPCAWATEATEPAANMAAAAAAMTILVDFCILHSRYRCSAGRTRRGIGTAIRSWNRPAGDSRLCPGRMRHHRVIGAEPIPAGSLTNATPGDGPSLAGVGYDGAPQFAREGEVTIELVIVLVLVIFNGFLSMSEMAIVSPAARDSRRWPTAASRGARLALALAERPRPVPVHGADRHHLGRHSRRCLQRRHPGKRLADCCGRADCRNRWPDADRASALVVIVTTYLSLIIGELVPKQIALRAPERDRGARRRPDAHAVMIATPVVWLLDLLDERRPARCSGCAAPRERVTEEEIRALIAEAEASGVFERRRAAHDLRRDAPRRPSACAPS